MGAVGEIEIVWCHHCLVDELAGLELGGEEFEELVAFWAAEGEVEGGEVVGGGDWLGEWSGVAPAAVGGGGEDCHCGGSVGL